MFLDCRRVPAALFLFAFLRPPYAASFSVCFLAVSDARAEQTPGRVTVSASRNKILRRLRYESRVRRHQVIGI